MNKLNTLLFAFAGVVAVSGPVAADTSDSKIVIKNNSAWAIHQLFLSPTEAREWGEDQLGKHTVIEGDVNGDGDADFVLHLLGKYNVTADYFDL